MAVPGQRLRGAGFTLVELLVTLFVIALIAGIAVVRFGNSDRQAVVDRETSRLAHVMEMAREEAILAGQEWGFTLTPESYGFLRLDEDENRWIELTDTPFASHALADGTTLRLSLLDRGRIDGRDTLVVTRNRSGQKPALLLLSSGEMTPFSVMVVPGDDSIPRRLRSDGFEAVRQVTEPDAR